VSENVNLSLDFEAPRKGGRGKGDSPIARVRVDSAWSYSKETGAPLITTDCRSAEDFEEETKRLKDELDAIVEEAHRRFGGEPVEAPAAPEEPAEPEPTKRVLSIRDGLCVRDRMTRDVKTLRPNDKICIADELMKVGRFRHIVVLGEEDEVVGVLSQSDICLSALAWAQGQGETAHRQSLETLPVKEVMRSTIETIDPDSSLADAAKKMIEDKIGCLPVTEKNRLVGILTEGDFLALLTDSSQAVDDPIDSH
jgi:CBS domain-containing protein